MILDYIEGKGIVANVGDSTSKICCFYADGLTDSLKEEEIRDIIIYTKMENICNNLVETAKPKSRDNISVIMDKTIKMAQQFPDELLKHMYDEVEFIGRSGFARVFKAKRRDGKIVAVKIPSKDPLEDV